MIQRLFSPPHAGKARGAILLSGSGSNAEVLLKRLRAAGGSYEVPLLFTDRPGRSRAGEIAAVFGLPLLSLDIFEFYAKAGENAIALTTPRRRELREAWSKEISAMFRREGIDFLLLAGFIPLSNVTRDFPALNIHPGDLTVEKDGVRIYAGLHRQPVERAILYGDGTLRSSVILTQEYEGNGKAQLDGGPVLAISSAMAIDYGSHSVEELREVLARREKGISDILSELAARNVERLKKVGDHVIFGEAAEAFIQGRYGLDEDQVLHFDGRPCRTVEFDAAGNARLIGWQEEK